MDPDGNRLQNSCSPRHWGHSTMHRVPPVSGTTTTMCMYARHVIYVHVGLQTYHIIEDIICSVNIFCQ